MSSEGPMGTAENPHAGQGMVVLDIGGDIGALIVTAPASMVGLEIEICPTDARHGQPDDGGDWWQGDWHSHAHSSDGSHFHSHSHRDAPAWPHVAVVGRPHGDGAAFAAVYPGLRAGRYDLWLRPNDPTAITASVIGGTVTNVDWPAAD